MNAQHTPGPWTIGTSCDHTPAVMVAVPPSEGSGFVVAHINRVPRMRSVHGEEAANARLIAAAPDMLDLARNVGGFDDSLLKSADLNVIRGTLRAFRDQARAILDKQR